MLDRLARSRYAFPVAILAIAAVAGIVVLVIQSGGDDGGSDEQASCEEVQAPAPKEVSGLPAPRERLDSGTTYAATVETNCGTFVIEVDQEESPRTAASFVALARDGFYDTLSFHRIAPGFVIQGGDPQGDGTGGPGYTVVGKPPASYHYRLGDVAMAKTQAEPPGAAGSQFFVISGSDGTNLQPEYGLLGHAGDQESLRTIKRIAALAVTDGAPSKPVWIVRARLERS